MKKDLEEYDQKKKEQDERKEEGFRKMAEEIELDSRSRGQQYWFDYLLKDAKNDLKWSDIS